MTATEAIIVSLISLSLFAVLVVMSFRGTRNEEKHMNSKKDIARNDPSLRNAVLNGQIDVAESRYQMLTGSGPSEARVVVAGFLREHQRGKF